jgi:hypothetical protein
MLVYVSARTQVYLASMQALIENRDYIVVFKGTLNQDKVSLEKYTISQFKTLLYLCIAAFVGIVISALTMKMPLYVQIVCFAIPFSFFIWNLSLYKTLFEVFRRVSNARYFP